MNRLIVIIGILFWGVASSQDSAVLIVQVGREQSLQLQKDETNLGYLFHAVRYQPRVSETYDVELDEFSSSTDSILFYLIRAEIALKGNEVLAAEAYENYLKALDKSININNQILICESAKRLMNYYVFNEKDEVSFQSYLDLHKKHAYDEIERLYNRYFELRAEVQYAIDKKELINVEPEVWTSLLNDCSSKSFYRLETYIRSLYAVYLEFHVSDYELAQEMYESLITVSSKVDQETEERMRFTALANIGAMLYENEDYQGSLNYLNQAKEADINQQKPRNLIYIYNWLSQTYTKLYQHDSAYFYLKKAYDTNQAFEISKKQIEVQEIEEKYQNESLKVDLMSNRLVKNRYLMMLLVSCALLLIGSLIYFAHIRVSRLTQVNLQQRLVNVEKESLLKAVNAKIDGEENERKRVASVLHDNIASHLAASRLHLKAAKDGNDEQELYLSKANDLLKEVSTSVRKLSHELYPPVLYQSDLLVALEHLCEKYSNNQIDFVLIHSSPEYDLSKDRSIKLFFIIQEIINNVIKHSSASYCTIEVKLYNSSLNITIGDNGIGGAQEEEQFNTGLGLNSVKARIISMGGYMRIDSKLSEGTKVMLDIPFNEVGDLS